MPLDTNDRPSHRDRPGDLTIRDVGPYSTRNTSKGALVDEAGKVFRALAGGMSIEQARQAALGGSLLPQRSRTNRKNIWDRIHYRYLSHRTDWIIASLIRTVQEGDHSREFVSLLYTHYALRDRLTYDFVTGVLWNLGYRNRPVVSRNAVLDLLSQQAPQHPEVERWRETSRLKLAGAILTALRDFGVLVGIQKKHLVRPVLPESTARHILRLLVAEGNRGRQILENATWRLFMLTEEDVAATLSKLSRDDDIQFEKVGTTVVLQTPEEWEAAQ